MTILFLIIIYAAIAAASVLSLILAASNAEIIPWYAPGISDLAVYILCGILWPLCLVPCMLYIGVKGHFKNQEKRR